ncbi:hypothetical protein JJV70_18910 [Streptomyces sp. JJ66]|uniref:hypothetical protein n=1 Tax=Streptomyces sp. JJ66 TaxID=2803843 RepID=UPI001C57CB4A|nr:hypothetical protein [Streptomyces sp. JJ66]MBW1604140.1 hypothetical protein [Streptomyces sp. JJ66]
MARVRTARIVAAAAAVPLALAAFGGMAQAHDGYDDYSSYSDYADYDAHGAFAGFGSNAGVVSSVGSGVLGDNLGNSTTNQQAATGWGASNQANNASVNGSGFTVIDQDNIDIDFSDLDD